MWITKDKIKCGLMSIGINSVVLMISLIFFVPQYEMPDDYGMNAIVNGVFGQYDNHTIFIHMWLSNIIVGLNRAFEGINWYSILQYGSVFGACCSLCYVLIRRDNKRGSIVSCIVMATCSAQLYVHPQFTKTAGVVTIIGILLIIVGEKLQIFGVLLVILGAMWRWRGWFFWPALMIPFGIVEILKNVLGGQSTKIKQTLLRYAKVVGIVLITTGICIGLWQINDAQYKKDYGWQNYTEWSAAMGELIDYFFPYYCDDYEMYEEMGISEDDLEYYSNWNIADTSILTVQNLQKMVEAKKSYWTSPKVRLVQFMQYAPRNFAAVSLFPLVCFLALFFLIFHEKKTMSYLPLQIVMMGILYFLMFYRGRVFVNRVDMPAFFSCVVGLAYYATGADVYSMYRKRIWGLFSNCCMACSIFMWWCMGKDNLRTQFDYQEKANDLAFLKYVSEDKQHLFIGTCGTIPITSVGVFERLPEGYLDNAYGTLGWLVNTPISENVLAQYNVQNIYEDCIDNDNVYWVQGEYFMESQKYINENYQNVMFNEAATISGWHLYEVQSN